MRLEYTQNSVLLLCLRGIGVMISTPEREISEPSSNSGRSLHLLSRRYPWKWYESLSSLPSYKLNSKAAQKLETAT